VHLADQPPQKATSNRKVRPQATNVQDDAGGLGYDSDRFRRLILVEEPAHLVALADENLRRLVLIADARDDGRATRMERATLRPVVRVRNRAIRVGSRTRAGTSLLGID
jgi:hypothetical protein